MNTSNIGSSYRENSNIVAFAAHHLFLDAVARQFSGHGYCASWQPDPAHGDGPLIKPGITVIEAHTDWLPEIALYLADLAESDGIPYLADPCSEELARFMTGHHQAMPEMISRFMPANIELMGRLGVTAPVAPQPWVGSPLAILPVERDNDTLYTAESLFSVQRMRALHALKGAGASVIILCNNLEDLPMLVLSAIDRRCVADGLRVDSAIFRRVVREFRGGAIVPLNPWSEVDRVVSPLWLTDYIARLPRSQPNLG
ncbi:hypothetical protein ACOSOMT5_P2901 [Acidiphilium sp. MT5]